jgi:hypothetical protein
MRLTTNEFCLGEGQEMQIVSVQYSSFIWGCHMLHFKSFEFPI